MSYMDVLSIVLPVSAFVCVLLLLFVNIYSKIRTNRLINVNCWFCNQWTKIPNDFYNSWDCPFCEQYNGFASDGGYNKHIPAQYDELMNKLPINVPIAANKFLDNGLCSTCNNNQQLKIQQLAMFSPIDDNNFDEEVEIYKEQLERAYKLCLQCDSILKNTLQKKKSLLLGIRLKTIKQQGSNYFNKKSYHIFSKTAIKRKFLTAIRYTTIIIAAIRICEIVKNYDFSHENLVQLLPSSLLPSILITKDLVILINNLISSIFVCVHYLQGIVLENCLSAITFVFNNTNIILKLSEYSIINTYFICNFLNQTKLQTFIGLFLQITYLKLNSKRKFRGFVKFIAWLIVVFLNTYIESNLSTTLIEIILYSLIIVIPSLKYEKVKIKRNKKPKILPIADTTELLTEELNKSPELLNDTFKSESPSIKLFSAQSFNNDNLFHVFGEKPVFENSLNISCFKNSQKYRMSSNESFSPTNDSPNSLNNSDNFNDFFCVSPTDKIENKSAELELNKCFNDLHLSAYSTKKRLNNSELPAAFRVSSSLLRPKPVLSPPRLQNVTQSPWVAGGYWKSNEFFNNFNGYSNISRSSSQSSGFSSQASSQQQYPYDNVFNSLPSSRTNSFCGEFDRYSVFSEPAYQYRISPTMCSKNKFYPDLRSDQQIYICPRPMNSLYSQNTSGKVTTINDEFCNNSVNNFAIPNRPCSRESIFAPTNYCSSFRTNNSYLPTSTILRPLSVSSNNSMHSKPFTKGSLLQKWREQNSTDIQNL